MVVQVLARAGTTPLGLRTARPPAPRGLGLRELRSASIWVLLHVTYPYISILILKYPYIRISMLDKCMDM